MKIQDNFLDQDEYDKLKIGLMGGGSLDVSGFPWIYNDIIDWPGEEPSGFCFIHMFYNNDVPMSPFLEVVDPILTKIKRTALIRVKANLLTRTPEIIKNQLHHDVGQYDQLPGPPYSFQSDETLPDTYSDKKLGHITTSIFYVNTNNGYTELEDGTKIESVANRLVSFPGNTLHTGTSCTDEKIRVVINFNYYE